MIILFQNRYVLSASDPVDSSPMHPSTRPTSQQDKMLELLRAQSYEALAIQDRTTAAQLQVKTMLIANPCLNPLYTKIGDSTNY